MKKEMIYLAIARTDYESDVPICAFDSVKMANEFVEKCEAHHKKRPTSPQEPPEDTPENDALYAAFFVKHCKWAKRHPAGSDCASCDSFLVIPVPKVSNVKLSARQRREDEL